VTPRIGRRLTLSSRHLAAATLWFEGQELTDDLREAGGELEAAGLARDGRVAPRLGDVLEVMLRPELRISLEVQTPTSTEADLLWLRGEVVVAAEVTDAAMVLEVIDPLLLPTDLARRLGVRGGMRPEPSEPLSVDAELLDRLEARARELAVDDLRTWVAEQGVTDPVWAAALVGAVRDRRATWRLGAGWMEGTEVRSRTLAVLDGGRAGAFEIEAADPAAPSSVTLHPRTSREVLERIRGCLP
jgi:hypothetical protein